MNWTQRFGVAYWTSLDHRGWLHHAWWWLGLPLPSLSWDNRTRRTCVTAWSGWQPFRGLYRRHRCPVVTR